MKVNKTVAFVLTLMVLIIGISAVSAADIDNNNTDVGSAVSVSSVSSQSSDVNDVASIKETKTVKSEAKTIKKEDKTVNTVKKESSMKTTKTTQQLLKEESDDVKYDSQRNTKVANNTININNEFTTTSFGNEIVFSDQTNNIVGTGENVATSLVIDVDETDNLFVGDNVDINLTLTDVNNNPISGNVILTIGDNINTVAIGNTGKATYTYTTTSVDILSVSAKYEGEDNYLACESNTIDIEVSKITPELTVEVADQGIAIVTRDAIIEGTLLDNKGGAIGNAIINVYVNNTLIGTNVTDSEGKYVYTYVPTTVGENIPVNVTFAGDDKYYVAVQTSWVDVEKIGTVVEVDIINNTLINKTAVVTGSLTEQYTDKAISGATIKVTVGNGVYTNTTDNEGKYSMIVGGQAVAGTYDVSVSYDGSTVYDESNDEASYDVEELDTIATSLVIDVDKTANLLVGDKIIINLTLLDGYDNPVSGKAVLTIGNFIDTVAIGNNGKANYTYTTTGSGSLTISAKYEGEDNYLACESNTIDIEVSKITPELTVEVADQGIAIVTRDTVINGTLVDNKGNAISGATINLYVNNVLIGTNVTDSKGKYVYTYVPTTVGESIPVNVSFAGDDKYYAAVQTSWVDVEKIGTYLEVDFIENTVINKTAIVTGSLTEQYTDKAISGATIKVTVGNGVYTNITDSEGKYSVVIDGQAVAGTYDVDVSYDGSSVYDESNDEASYDVERLDTTTTLDSVNVTINDAVTLTARVVDVNNKVVTNGNVTFMINNNVIGMANVVNGIATYNTIAQQTWIKGNISAIYSGSNVYSSSKDSVTVTVGKLDVKVALPNYDMYIFDYSSIVVNVTDEYGNAVNAGYLIFKVNGVTLKSNGKFYSQETNPMKFSVVNGKATIVFNATSFYNKKYVHSMIVKYSGTTSQYNSASSDTKTLSINKRIGYMTVTTDKTSYNLYETVNIKVTYYDITHGNATPIYADGSCYAIYKINGVTSKVNGSDEKFAINNSQVLIGNNSKSQINYIHIDHTAPNKKDYHTIDVKTHNEYYTTLVGNTTIKLNKSPTHIDVNKITYNKTSNKITISADIKDYMNNNTKGVNYYSVKINGITYKAQGKSTFNTTGGNIEITIDSTTKNLRNIELVTREKLAYDGSRTTTTDIQTVK